MRRKVRTRWISSIQQVRFRNVRHQATLFQHCIMCTLEQESQGNYRVLLRRVWNTVNSRVGEPGKLYCQFSISCGIWWVMSVRVNCWNLLSPVWRVLWIPFKNEMHTVYVLNTEIPKGDVKRLSSAPIVLWSTTILCCLTFRPAFRLVFCPTFRLALCVLCVNGWLHLEESIPL